jgi:hypothetical protein
MQRRGCGEGNDIGGFAIHHFINRLTDAVGGLDQRGIEMMNVFSGHRACGVAENCRNRRLGEAKIICYACKAMAGACWG